MLLIGPKDQKHQDHFPKLSKNSKRTKNGKSRTGGRFFWGSMFFDFGGSKNVFNLCSHIELNTQNPNPTFKITICLTKTPTSQNTFEMLEPFEKIGKSRKFKFLFCKMSNLYNSLFVAFVIFVNLGIWVFLVF